MPKHNDLELIKTLSDEELCIFCYDDFKQVYDDLTNQTSKTQVIGWIRDRMELPTKKAFSIPALFRATGFLFEEANEIFQECRERRKSEDSIISPEIDAFSLPPENETSDNVINSKNVALDQVIEESIWLASTSEVEHLLTLLDVYRRNYRLAKEQYAKWGGALVPPIIVSNLIEAEDEIVKTTKKLQAVLSKIYGKQIINPEIE